MRQPAPWVICPQPYPDELLSSYLVRIAHSNGKSPSRFCAFHFPDVPIWNRDVDRNATTAFLCSVARHSQLSEAAIRNMTLQAWEAALTPSSWVSRPVRPSWAPWMNTLGIYHRSRRRYGLQYCPSCLAETGFYRKVWRLSFVTVCQKHACDLLDRCRYCSAPIAFHRNEALHLHCHGCGRSLIHPTTETKDDPEYQARFTLQQQLLSALNDGRIIIANETVPSRHFFLGLSMLLRAVKAKLRIAQRHPHALLSNFTCPTGQIEMLCLNERVPQCLVLAQLLDDWPRQFLELATAIGLTQRAFERTTSLPAWLEKVVALLPIGEIRVRRRRRAVVRQKLRRIHRHKTIGWRTERASLLLKTAGRKA